jgi:hypothetical protein
MARLFVAPLMIVFSCGFLYLTVFMPADTITLSLLAISCGLLGLVGMR